MPYKSEKMLLTREFDRRVKLTEEQRNSIRKEYETGLYSQQYLADKYGVSKRLINITIHPEKYETMKEQRRNRGKDGRYRVSKEEQAAIIREHRKYKQELYLRGKISEDNMSEKNKNKPKVCNKYKVTVIPPSMWGNKEFQEIVTSDTAKRAVEKVLRKHKLNLRLRKEDNKIMINLQLLYEYIIQTELLETTKGNIAWYRGQEIGRQEKFI